MPVRRALCILSALWLTMGVFAPLIDVFRTTTNFYNNGEGDGSVVLVLVVIILLMTPFTHRKWIRRGLWPVGGLIGSIVLIDFVDAVDRVGFDNMSWGWIALFIGSIVALAAAAWPTQPRGQAK